MTTVIIPWRPQPSRVYAFEVVEAWYRRELPGARIVTIDSGDEPFNLARCRNLGVADAAALSGDDEVVVISDADTLPEAGALAEAIDAAAHDGRVHLPYTAYHWLGRDGTAELLAGTAPELCSYELVRGACSGVYVTTPASWAAHGGQDERFRGWGFEDAAWYLAHSVLLGAAPVRHEGRVYALQHETAERSGPRYDANAALMARYRAAADAGADARAEMTALCLSGHGGGTRSLVPRER